MKKARLLAILLAIVMVVSVIPVAAYADDDAFKAKSSEYLKLAAEGVVKTERVFLASKTFTEVKASSDVPLAYNQFEDAFYLDGDKPTEKAPLLLSTDVLLETIAEGLGPFPGLFIDGPGVYEFGFNEDGIALDFAKLVFDPFTGYGAPDTESKTIRIGEYGKAEGDMYSTYKYDDDTKVYIIKGEDSELTLTEKAFDELVLDNNDAVSIFYDYVSMTDRTLTELYITEVDGVGERADTFVNSYWSLGVNGNDAEYGFDTLENPYTVEFAMYDPVEHGGNDADAKYPLVIDFHGNYGGIVRANVAGRQANYKGEDYQSQFETDTEGVNGAFVANFRAADTANSVYQSQCWLTGYRGGYNPIYDLKGNEDYAIKPVQFSAVISNIRWLVENNPNIDPDRVYIISQSAGGYATLQTLFEAARLGYDDLITAAISHKGAFFPSGSQISDDPHEVEYDLEDKLIGVKDTALWLFSAVMDPICMFNTTMGDTFREFDNVSTEMMNPTNPHVGEEGELLPMEKLGGAITMNEAVAYLSTIGNPLTRVSVHTSQGHDDTVIPNNNRYPADTEAREGVTPNSYTEYYGEKPEDFDIYSVDMETAYSFGADPEFSSGSYTETFIEWFNKAGNAKAGGPAVEVDEALTRAELAQAFYDIYAEDDEEEYSADFADIDEDYAAYAAIAFCQAKGYMLGYPDGSFGPDRTLTRAEICAAIVRIKGLELTAENPFPDVGEHWAVEYIGAMYAEGFINGYPDGTFRADNAVTTSEASTMLSNVEGRDITI